MESPLVTVICLCFNHERFVKESIESILLQTHPRIQVVVVDDGSTDRSVEIIRETIKSHPEIPFLSLKENFGNCRAFNKGFAWAKGDYIIDLAADDVLMPHRIAEGLKTMESCGASYGVNFSDAELIDEAGNHIGFHSDRFPHASIPHGDIYRDLIARYFISSPTMMMRRSVLKKLDGYDESLAYEDFDFWIRSSREFKYCYTAEPLVKRRMVKTSMAGNQYKPQSLQMVSTFRVCEKIILLNRNREERKALGRRIRYEMKRALEVRAWSLAFNYFKLLVRNGT